MQQADEQPLLECVPNFSEGRNPERIEAIAASIRRVEGVNLLHIDPGFDANRTVMTFVGAPQAVVEAAFQGIKTAAQVIDMRQHHGAHPRADRRIGGRHAALRGLVLAREALRA